MFLFHVIDFVIPIPNLDFLKIWNGSTDMESSIFNFSGQFLPKNKETQNTEFEGPGFFYDVMDTAKFHFILLHRIQITTVIFF